MSTGMTYAQAEQWLRSLELFGMRFGLERIARLMTALGSPQERFRSVQVVGTNGKSSTVRMIAALLSRHGFRTGAYLSPHLASFAERVEVGGRPVGAERFAAAVARAAHASALVERGLPPDDRVTQFEALTAAAFSELERAAVEVAAVEAGLGGRYDATSVVRARVLALTNVGLEHTRWLGPSERHIAEEKLTVTPAGGALVAGPIDGDVLAVAERAAREKQARLLLAGRDFSWGTGVGPFAVRTPTSSYDGIELCARGVFQRENFALAIVAAEELLASIGRGQALDAEAVRSAAREVLVPGRLEVRPGEPLLVLDGAHNPSAVAALVHALPEITAGRALVGVVSVLDDKDAAGMLDLLRPLLAGVVFTRSSHERALPPATLASLWRQLGGTPAEVVGQPAAALERARALTGSDGVVLATGSIYMLSDLAVAPRTAATAP